MVIGFYLLCGFHNDIGQHIGRLIANIGRIAQVAVDLAHLQHDHHMFDVLRPAEQIRDRFPVDRLDPVLQCLGPLNVVAGNVEVFILDALPPPG